MNPEELKNHLLPAKNWITTNQKTNGAILWDESGKWDAWDHSECLIALAIYEDWEAFELGIEFLIENLSHESLIKSEFVNGKISQDYYEAHHVAYVFLPLLQRFFIDKNLSFLQKHRDLIHEIYKSTKTFQNLDGFYHWAKDKNGFSDNSLITSTCSIELSRRAYNQLCEILGDSEKIDSKPIVTKENLSSEAFNRDGIDRSRFSMDSYYPMLCNIVSPDAIHKLIENFYVEGLGIKCVKEEPWVTFAETSECVMALYKSGEHDKAKEIFKHILKHANHRNYFPTGYQYELKVYWPEENSTWTNAAIIMAADCLFDFNKKEKVILI